MAKIKRHLFKRKGYSLIPADNDALEFIKSLGFDKDYAVEVRQVRNLDGHKKAFSYIKLAFDYWEPKRFVNQIEINLVDKQRKFFISQGISEQAATELSRQFLRELNESRRGQHIEKNIDAFRDHVTIEAGFYSLVHTPNGPKKIADSWAFKNMSQEKFEQLWQSIRRVCWDMVLHSVFKDTDEAEAAAMQLLSYD